MILPLNAKRQLVIRSNLLFKYSNTKFYMGNKSLNCAKFYQNLFPIRLHYRILTPFERNFLYILSLLHRPHKESLQLICGKNFIIRHGPYFQKDLTKYFQIESPLIRVGRSIAGWGRSSCIRRNWIDSLTEIFKNEAKQHAFHTWTSKCKQFWNNQSLKEVNAIIESTIGIAQFYAALNVYNLEVTNRVRLVTALPHFAHCYIFLAYFCSIVHPCCMECCLQHIAPSSYRFVKTNKMLRELAGNQCNDTNYLQQIVQIILCTTLIEEFNNDPRIEHLVHSGITWSSRIENISIMHSLVRSIFIRLNCMKSCHYMS